MATATVATSRRHVSAQKSTKSKALQVVPAPATPVVSDKDKRLAEKREKRRQADKRRRQAAQVKRDIRNLESADLLRCARTIRDKIKEDCSRYTDRRYRDARSEYASFQVDLLRLGQSLERFAGKLIQGAAAPTPEYNQKAEALFAVVQDSEGCIRELEKLRAEIAADRMEHLVFDAAYQKTDYWAEGGSDYHSRRWFQNPHNSDND